MLPLFNEQLSALSDPIDNNKDKDEIDNIMKIIHKEKVTAACGCTSCVNLKDPRIHSIYDGRLVYFCANKCKQEFDDNPDEFLDSDHFKIEFEQLDKVEERIDD